MTRFSIEIREYPTEEKAMVEDLTNEELKVAVKDCERLLDDLKHELKMSNRAVEEGFEERK